MAEINTTTKQIEVGQSYSGYTATICGRCKTVSLIFQPDPVEFQGYLPICGQIRTNEYACEGGLFSIDLSHTSFAANIRPILRAIEASL